MNRVLPAVALGGTQRRFQARILVRKEVKGATVLMCTHLATGQADGVEEAHARCPEVKSSSRLSDATRATTPSTLSQKASRSWGSEASLHCS